MANVFTVGIRMDLDAKAFEAGLGAVSQKLDSVGQKLTGMGKSMSMFVTAPVVAAFGFAVDAASDLSESLSKTQVVFSDASAGVLAWSETSAEAFGLSRQQALEAASTYGNLFTSMGMSGSAAADMSTDMVELAADLASFNNTSIDDALLALRSGLVGETEPLKRFGILINETTLKQKAMEMGLVDANGNISEQNKVLVRNALIMEQSTNAQGDFARTSGGFANQVRILRARLGNMAATIGSVLLPVVLKIVGVFQKVLDVFFALPRGAVVVGVVMAAIAAAIGPVLIVLGTLVSAAGTVLAILPAIGPAFLAMLGPVAIIIAAIAALAVAWRRNVGGIQDKTKAFADYVGKLFRIIGPMINVVKALLGLGDNTLGHTLIKLGTAMRLVGFSQKQIDGLRSFFRGLTDEAEKAKIVAAAVKKVFVTIGEVVIAGISALISPLGRMFSGIGRLLGWVAGKIEVAFAAVMRHADEIRAAFGTLGNILRGAAGIIGTVVGKIGDVIGRVIGFVIGIWDRLGSSVQRVIKVVAGVFLAVGPVMAILAPVVGVIGSIIGAVIGVISAIGGVVGAIAGVFALVLSPLGLIIAALALIGIAYKTNFLGFGDAVRSVAKWLGSIDWMGWAKKIGNAMAVAWKVIKRFVMQVVGAFQPMTDYVKESFDRLRNIFRADGVGGVLKALPGIYWGYLKKIPEVFSRLGPLIVNTIANIVGSIRTGNGRVDEALGQLTKVFRDVADFLGALFSGDFRGAFEALKNLFMDWGKYAGMLGSMIWDGISAGFNAIPWGTMWDVVSGVDWVGLGQTILGKIGEAANAVGSLVKKLEPHAVEMVNGFVAWIVAFDWLGLGRTILSLIGNAVLAIGSLLAKLEPYASDFVAGFVNWITNYNWVGLGTSILGFIGNAVAAIGSLLKKLEPYAMDMINGFVAWIVAFDWLGLGRTILSLIGNAVSAIGSLLEKLVPLATDFVSGFVDWIAGYDWAGLGGSILGYIGDAVAAIGSLAETLVGLATEMIDGFANWVRDYDWVGLGTNILGYIGDAVEAVGSLLLLLVPLGEDLITGLSNGIDNIWSTVSSFFSNIGQTVLDAIGDLGSTLWNAGWSLMNGLWDGIKRRWQDVKDWLGGVADEVRSVKGPIEKDRVMLYAEGQAIMIGLLRGMKSQETNLTSYLGGLTNAIGGMSFSVPAISANVNAAAAQIQPASITINVSGAGDPKAVGEAVYATLSRELTLRNGV